MVPANLAQLRSDVIQDPEFRPSRAPLKLRFNLGFCRRKLRWNRLSGNQPGKLFTCHLGKSIEVAHLLLEVVVSAVEPEALCCAPVNAQRTADGIPVLSGLQLVVLWEDLDPFPQPASLDRHPQPQSKVVHVNPAVPRRQWVRHKDPEVPAAVALLKRRLHSILFEVVAKLDEVWERILVIRVDGHPLTPLSSRVDGIEGDGDFAIDVAPEGVRRQAEALAGFLVRGPEVVM